MRIGLLFTITFSCFYFSAFPQSCDCPPLSILTKDQCETYDAVFYGRVDSVSACDKSSIAFFSIQEVYRGAVPVNADVIFDCTSACQMSLLAGEKWMVYANYIRYGQLEINFCGRSRKEFFSGEKDYYLSTNKMSFQEERNFLIREFGLQQFRERQDASFEEQRQLIKPQGMETLWLAGISIGVLLLLLFLLRRYL